MTRSHSQPRRRSLLVGLGAGVLVLVVGLVALALWGDRSGPQAVSSPVGTPSETLSPSPTLTSDEPTQTPTPTAAPTKKLTPYCQAYSDIVNAPPSAAPDDETGMDFEKLSKTYATLILRYSAAAKVAPAGLKGDYAKIIRFLKDVKITVDSHNWKAVIAQMRQLEKMNATMESIQKKSEAICA